MPQPEKNVPIAIMGTVFIGFVTSFAFIISMMFSLLDLDSVSAGLAPVLNLFYGALGNKAGAIVLEALVIATGVGCQIACTYGTGCNHWSLVEANGLHANCRLKCPTMSTFESLETKSDFVSRSDLAVAPLLVVLS